MSVQLFSQAEFSYSDDHRVNRKHAVAHPVLKLLPLNGPKFQSLSLLRARFSTLESGIVKCCVQL
jgi:hypothetical protein